MKRELEGEMVEKAAITTKIEEVELHNDTAQRELLKTVGKKQVCMHYIVHSQACLPQ